VSAPSPARRAAALFALAERGVLEVTGADRVAWLDGMLTNDVRSLAAAGPRSGCHALALTREGRIVAEVHVLARPEALLLETEREAIGELTRHLGRYIVADDVQLRDASGDWERLSVEGPAAPAVLAATLGAPFELAPDAVAEAPLAGARVLAAAYSLSGLGGVQLLAPAGAGAAVCAALLAAGRALGLAEAAPAELEVLRVEQGVPRQGRELTPEVLPAEARLERAVSETKGCFTGQEVVTRMRSRGRVSHLLVGLRFGGSGLPAPGSELTAGERVVGSVTSALRSPRLGAIGLGFVRHGEAGEGSALRAGGAEAQVSALPFPDPV
jgi:folate-binding protein YgfZ